MGARAQQAEDDMAFEPAHQAHEDNIRRELDTTDARQGAVSGRVITVLIASMVLVGAIFALMWLRIL
jgi:hypothetical protein